MAKGGHGYERHRRAVPRVTCAGRLAPIRQAIAGADGRHRRDHQCANDASSIASFEGAIATRSCDTVCAPSLCHATLPSDGADFPGHHVRCKDCGWGARIRRLKANPLRKALKTFVFRRPGKSVCHIRTLQGSVASQPTGKLRYRNGAQATNHNPRQEDR